MRRLAGRAAFTVGDREYRGEDLVLAAHLWGEFAGLERQTRCGIACLRHLETHEAGLDAAFVEEAGDAWRYERDLLSADDMQDWLAGRNLDMDEWLLFVQRMVARTQCSAELDEIAEENEVTGEEIDAALYSEIVCSGRLAELAEQLAGQAAVFDRAAEQSRAATSSSKAERKTLLDELPASVRRKGILGIVPKVIRERAELLARVAFTFQRFIDGIAAPAALEREIEAHALEWTRLDCQTVGFAAAEAAREAALLVREDGMGLAQAAAIATSVVEDTPYVLEDVEAPLKDRLVGALPGDLIGPLAVDGGYVLVSVVNRVAPTAKDPSISGRARDRVIRRTIRREISRRVRWHERF